MGWTERNGKRDLQFRDIELGVTKYKSLKGGLIYRPPSFLYKETERGSLLCSEPLSPRNCGLKGTDTYTNPIKNDAETTEVNWTRVSEIVQSRFQRCVQQHARPTSLVPHHDGFPH